MSTLDKLNLMKDRKNVLLSRGKDNYKIVRKIERKIKLLENSCEND